LDHLIEIDDSSAQAIRLIMNRLVLDFTQSLESDFTKGIELAHRRALEVAQMENAAHNRVQHDIAEQPPLKLAGSFTPSEELLRAWRKNVETTLHKARTSYVPDRVASEEFSKAITSVIGSIGQEKRYSEKRSRAIAAENGRFDPLIQVEICERFLIVPDQAARFLALLEREIYEFVSNGPAFAGAWGRLRAEQPRRLVFDLQQPNFRHENNFVRAKEVR
jgi:hypothetical protein